MNDKEAVLSRRSRRAYLNQPLDQSLVESLNLQIKNLNDRHGLAIQPVFDRPDLFGGFLRNYGLFKGVRHFLILAGPKGDPDLYEKLGFFGQKIVLELTKANLGTCWVGGSFDKKAVESLVDPNHKIAAVIVFGMVPQHETPREQLIHSFTHLKKHPPDLTATTDGTQPAWFSEALDFVLRSPSALNRLPTHFFVREGHIYSGLTVKDPVAFVDLGIAKAQFGIAHPEGTWSWGEQGEFHYPSNF